MQLTVHIDRSLIFPREVSRTFGHTIARFYPKVRSAGYDLRCFLHLSLLSPEVGSKERVWFLLGGR